MNDNNALFAIFCGWLFCINVYSRYMDRERRRKSKESSKQKKERKEEKKALRINDEQPIQQEEEDEVNLFDYEDPSKWNHAMEKGIRDRMLRLIEFFM